MNGSFNWLWCAARSDVRLGRMPMPIRISPIAEELFWPLEAPFSHFRNFQAASCWSCEACLLTTSLHEYETLCDPLPLGPTGTGAVATCENLSFMLSLSALSHQLAMIIIAVLPLAKLSRNGPVVEALASPIAGSVTLSSKISLW